MVSQDLMRRLCSASRRLLVDPYSAFDWPEGVDRDGDWFMPPTLSSLYGTPVWEALSEQERRRLSFFELVNFFSLTIAGERLLVQQMARYLYRPDYADHTPYLHHFLEEENRHMVWFGTFCSRYAGKVYASRYCPWPGQHEAGEEEFRFWVSVLAFEEMGDVYNRIIGDDARVNAIARAINRAHHREESRHLAFGRVITREVWERHSPKWSPEVKARVQDYAGNYLIAQFHDYFNPAAYADSGVPEPYHARGVALEGDAAKARFQVATSSCVRVLIDAGVLAAPPMFAPY